MPSTLARTSLGGSNRSDMVFAGPLVNHPNRQPPTADDPPAAIPPGRTAAVASQPSIPNVTFYHTMFTLSDPSHCREMKRRLPSMLPDPNPLPGLLPDLDLPPPTLRQAPPSLHGPAAPTSDDASSSSGGRGGDTTQAVMNSDAACGGQRLCATLLVALRDLVPGEELYVGEHVGRFCVHYGTWEDRSRTGQCCHQLSAINRPGLERMYCYQQPRQDWMGGGGTQMPQTCCTHLCQLPALPLYSPLSTAAGDRLRLRT